MNLRKKVKVHVFWEGRFFCEISTVYLTYLVMVKSTVEISQNVLAFSEYMNFIALNHNIDIVDIVSIFMNQSLLLRLSNS